MILNKCNFFSKTLLNHVDVDILLPGVGDNDCVGTSLEDIYAPQKPFPVLYLLHGALDDHTMWLRHTNIEEFAEKAGLAVVMPSGQNGFYTNAKYGLNYFDFITKELPLFVQKYFPVSTKREDTYIAGPSMGGYGALKIALSHSDAFEKVACYSAAFGYVTREYTPYWNSVFGDTPEKREKHRIETYIENNIAGNNRKPPVYMWCGTEDGLLQSNRDTRDLLISKGFDVTYSESEGGHEWRCWDEQFRRSLDFFGI